MAEVLLCKTCRHYRSSNIAAMSDYCTHPAYAKPADLVRGEPRLSYCDQLRSNEDACGKGGKSWEAA